MAVLVKCLCLVAFLVVVGINPTAAAGECPNSSPDAEATKLSSCLSAAKDPNVAVPASCCAQVRQLGVQNPACLCAAMLSNTAKNSGVKPEVALTIPKRCNFADKPIGYKCGGYTMP